MNYTPTYARQLLELIHSQEKELKEKYDVELYLHIQNMRSELRMINDLERLPAYRWAFNNVLDKFNPNEWTPKLTICSTTTPH